MNNKLKQKTTWAGIAAIVAALGGVFSGGLPLLQSVLSPEFLAQIGMGLSLIAAPEET